MGSDGTSSSSVSAYGVGKAGLVYSQQHRASFEAVQALNASFTPTTPLLSGGSGGGGGQGASQHLGSGGGGGGGVIVIVAKNLVVAKGGGTITAAGGNGGTLVAGGPFNATSGGGGGGGLILLATLSNPVSYEGLIMEVGGGISVNNNGAVVYAKPGRIVNWFSPNKESIRNQFMLARKTVDQHISVNSVVKSVVFDDVSQRSGIVCDVDMAIFSVSEPGLYLIQSDLIVDGSAELVVIKNGDDELQFGKRSYSNTQNMSTTAILHLQPKDTIEIRITREDRDPSQSITIKHSSSLAIALLSNN
jgi:hypothetical protein